MLQAIIKYIEKKGWTLHREGERYFFFKPPSNLGFDDKYTMPIPKIEQSQDYQKVLDDTAKIIADIYNINVSQFTHNVTDYFEILKKDAIYFKLNSENLMFQQTLEINDVWTFLKNLSTSYTNYTKIEFAKNFYPMFGADNDRIKVALNKLLDLTRLRVVALEYKSFSVGVSSDNFVGKTEIAIKEIQEWRGELVRNYKNDVIDINFDSREDVDRLMKQFSDEERRKIFDPLISSINNNSDFSISVTDQDFNPKRKLKRISSQIVDIIIPKEIKEQPKKKIGFYKTIIPIDESKSSINLKVRDLNEDNLFTQKLDEIDIPINTLNYENKVIRLKKDIQCSVAFNNDINLFDVFIIGLNATIQIKDLNELQEEVNDRFEKMINYYLKRTVNLDARGVEMVEYLKSILTEPLLEEISKK